MTRWRNAEFDAWVDQWLKSPEGKERMKAFPLYQDFRDEEQWENEGGNCGRLTKSKLVD